MKKRGSHLTQVLLGHFLCLTAAIGLYFFVTRILGTKGGILAAVLVVFGGYFIVFKEIIIHGESELELNSYVLMAGVWSIIIAIILGILLAVL